jgi:hypothetical protein
MSTSKLHIVALLIAVNLGIGVSAGQLGEFPVGEGGEPTGIWEAGSFEIDFYATPTLLAAISDLAFSGSVVGQISFNSQNIYRSEFTWDVEVSFTIAGGPLTVKIDTTISENGSWNMSENLLILTQSSETDSLGFTVLQDTLSLIQEVPLGDLGTLAASLDPNSGPPLSVLRLIRVQGAGQSADFDNSGSVDFADFLAFAANFGKRTTDGDFDPSFDLDSDGEVGFTDFLAFVNQFG